MDVVAWEWQQGRHKDIAVLKTMKQLKPWHLPEAGPHVQYIWGDAHTAEPPTDALRQAAHLLHTLGWGVDMAYADVTPERPGGDVYEPAVAGERRMTPMAGTLDDLKAAYQRFQVRSTGKGVDSDTRPSMLISQPYQRAGEEFRPAVCFRLMKGGRSGKGEGSGLGRLSEGGGVAAAPRGRRSAQRVRRGDSDRVCPRSRR